MGHYDDISDDIGYSGYTERLKKKKMEVIFGGHNRKYSNKSACTPKTNQNLGSNCADSDLQAVIIL